MNQKPSLILVIAAIIACGIHWFGRGLSQLYFDRNPHSGLVMDYIINPLETNLPRLFSN
jgi:hypothetical protein